MGAWGPYGGLCVLISGANKCSANTTNRFLFVFNLDLRYGSEVNLVVFSKVSGVFILLVRVI